MMLLYAFQLLDERIFHLIGREQAAASIRDRTWKPLVLLIEKENNTTVIFLITKPLKIYLFCSYTEQVLYK